MPVHPFARAAALALALALAAPPAWSNTTTKDIRHLDQTDPRGFDPETTTGEVNCTPTAIIQCLEWWSRHGYPGLVPNANLAQMYEAVHQIGRQGRISKRGFGWHQVKQAIEQWLKKHGNPRLTIKGHDSNVTYQAVAEQFLPTAANPNGQDVIWLGTQVKRDERGQDVEGAGHAMTMESLDPKSEVDVPGESGKGRRVSFADPASGRRRHFVMGPSGALYEGSPLRKVYSPGGFYTICPS